MGRLPGRENWRTMPMLFWLPAIFMGAFFELARIAWGGAMLPDDPKTT